MHARCAFTKLVVDDLDAMSTYYAEVFGLHPVQRLQAKIIGAPIEQVVLGHDGERSTLILLRWVDREAPPTGEVIIGFTTSDIAALFARAEAAGGSVREPPCRVDIAGGVIVGFVADPEGHVAEVVEQPAA